MHVRQTAIDPVVIERELFMIETEQMKNRRVKIRNRHLVLGDKIADIVAGTVTKAFLHSSAREETGEH